MKHAILHFRDRHLPEQGPEKPVSVALVTGSLGPGGAERQLTRLAGELTRLAEQPGQVPLDLLPKPEKSKCWSSSTPSRRARPEARPGLLPARAGQGADPGHGDQQAAAGLGVPSIRAGGRLGRLLEQLPPPVHYGVTRLAPVLRTNPFDVVSLWQDGTCLFGALAALLAGAPTIHLVFRGLPPNIRKDRFREEYPELYQALAQVPGVHFVSNSRKAAEPIRNGSASPSCASMCCTTACRILPPTPPPRTRTNGGRSRKTRPMPRKPSAACSAWNRTNGRSCGSSSRRST